MATNNDIAKKLSKLKSIATTGPVDLFSKAKKAIAETDKVPLGNNWEIYSDAKVNPSNEELGLDWRKTTKQKGGSKLVEFDIARYELTGKEIGSFKDFLDRKGDGEIQEEKTRLELLNRKLEGQGGGIEVIQQGHKNILVIKVNVNCSNEELIEQLQSIFDTLNIKDSRALDAAFLRLRKDQPIDVKFGKDFAEVPEEDLENVIDEANRPRTESATQAIPEANEVETQTDRGRGVDAEMQTDGQTADFGGDPRTVNSADASTGTASFSDAETGVENPEIQDVGIQPEPSGVSMKAAGGSDEHRREKRFVTSTETKQVRPRYLDHLPKESQDQVRARSRSTPPKELKTTTTRLVDDEPSIKKVMSKSMDSIADGGGSSKKWPTTPSPDAHRTAGKLNIKDSKTTSRIGPPDQTPIINGGGEQKTRQ